MNHPRPPTIPSPAMLRTLVEMADHCRRYDVQDQNTDQYLWRTVEALAARGMIRLWQSGTRKSKTMHGREVGPYSRRGYGQGRWVSTDWNVPVHHARITAAGWQYLAEHGR